MLECYWHDYIRFSNLNMFSIYSIFFPLQANMFNKKIKFDHEEILLFTDDEGPSESDDEVYYSKVIVRRKNLERLQLRK